MKLLGKILLAIVVVLTLVVVFRNSIAAFALEQGVKKVMGLNVTTDSVRVGLSPQVIHIKGLKVRNPPDFPEDVMLDAPEIFVDYVLADILTGKMHLNEARLHVKEFNVVKNEKGQLNLDAVKVVKDDKAEEGQAEPKEEPPSQQEFMIKHLVLRVDHVNYKEYRPQQSQPILKEYPVKVNVEYSNIDDVEDVARLIIVQALTRTSIARLTSFDVQSIGDELTGLGLGTLSTAEDVLKDTVNEAGGLLKGLGDSLRGMESPQQK